MSVDLSLIIPNKCISLRNKKDARKCFDDTIERITKYFHGHRQFVSEIIIRDEVDDPDDIMYSFDIPILDINASMRTGFWDIWPGARYFHYFCCPHALDIFGKPIIRARSECFNIALAFAQREAWVCDEYHSWNCPLESIDSNFEDWKAYGENAEDATIYEYNVMDFANNTYKATVWSEYQTKYHDEFKECFAVLEEIKRRFLDYEILLVDCPLPCYVLAAKGDDLFFLNMETGDSLTELPIDNCSAEFNGAGVQIFIGEESAFFNMMGKQLTDFRKGDFKWEWDNLPTEPYRQAIIDEATGKSFYTDGTPCSDRKHKHNNGET